jgi:hypothetical protein
MEKYYLLEGKNVLGPFSKNELAERRLTMDSLLCREGSNDWKGVSEFSELNSLKSVLPPPPPPRNIQKKKVLANFIKIKYLQLKSKNVILFFLSLVLSGVVTGCFYFCLISGGWEEYSSYRRLSEYIANNPQEVQMENDYAKSFDIRNPGMARGATSLSMQRYFKDRYEWRLKKSFRYGIYAFFLLFFGTVVFVFIKHCVNWVKENADD